MKILILMMTNAGFYEEQGKIMKSALQELINKLNLQDNISIYSYIGDNKNRRLDNETKTIYLTSPDVYDYMYIKTIEAFEFVNDNNFDYDFLVRINTSEFINIKLLYELCKKIYDNKVLYQKSYSCQIVSFADPNVYVSFAPYGGYPILQGKFMMFSKETVKQIIDNKYIFYDDKYPNAGYIVSYENNGKTNCIDDIAISAVLNILNKDKNFTDYLSDIKDLPLYHSSFNLPYEILKQRVTICIKAPGDINEISINTLKNIFLNHVNDDIIEEINDNLKNINNSTVYIRLNGEPKYIRLDELIKIDN